MGKIKSAWEIALEKTENIVVDEDKIRHSQAIDKIRRIAGAYLLGEDDDKDKNLEELKAYTNKELKEALERTILNSISLPLDEVEDDRFERTGNLLSIVADNDEQTLTLYSQITNLLKQYPVHRKQLIEQMKTQFEPMLREKEAQMREQYGQDVHLSLETDKEFAQVVRQNLDKLEAQYQQTLDGAKENLKQIFL